MTLEAEGWTIVRDDKPAGWRGEMTVAVPMTARGTLLAGDGRLSPLGADVHPPNEPFWLDEASGLTTEKGIGGNLDQARLPAGGRPGGYDGTTNTTDREGRINGTKRTRHVATGGPGATKLLFAQPFYALLAMQMDVQVKADLPAPAGDRRGAAVRTA